MSYTWNYLLDKAAQPMYNGISEHVLRTQATSILDIGCGYASWIPFYQGSADITGIDSDDGAIDYCRANYTGEFLQDDAFDLGVGGQYDVIVLGGLLYYMKGERSPLDYVEDLISRYNPRHIVIQEPFPSISHQSPDFIPLLDRYAWHGEYYDLDIRMGQRIVITLQVDQVRPQRREKGVVDNQQNTFDLNTLQFGVYTANTEAVDHHIDGRVFPAEPARQSYTSVCAGFKSLYKACIDYTPNQTQSFTWFDISPTAVLYRMYQDMMRARTPSISWDRQLDIYRTDYDDRIVELRDQTHSIDDTVDAQLSELNIPLERWRSWLHTYAKSPRRYVKCDIVNNLKYARQFVEPGSWLWYSNVFDWHQFSFPERSKNAWMNYMERDDVTLVGKYIPTSIETIIADRIRKSSPAEGYDNILWSLVNRLYRGSHATHICQDNLIVKENDYALTIRNNECKLKVYTGYSAVLAADNYQRCRHLIPGHHSEHTVDGIRIETYEFIPGLTLDNVDPSVYNNALQSLIHRLTDGLAAVSYPYDISPYNMVYTPDDRVEIIDWDYTITGSRQDLRDRIQNMMED